jgi:YVTN family beta-propeller protein
VDATRRGLRDSPRPGSSDVAVIDPSTLAFAKTIHVGRQPLVAVVLDAGQIIARDWKTGDLLRANLS